MARPSDEQALNRALELMHFGFRALVAEPDRILGRHGLSRVHHRLLYFVARHPGCSVSELLRATAVTKQALARPLRELTRRKLLEMRAHTEDGRVKRLVLTTSGRALERRLSGIQRGMFAAAFRAAGTNAEQGWRTVMRRLVAPLHRVDGD